MQTAQINFSRNFSEYQPPRAMENIEVDIKIIEQEIVRILPDRTGHAQHGRVAACGGLAL
jgi:hypothetical protein